MDWIYSYILSWYTVQKRPVNGPDRWSVQQYNMFYASNIDECYTREDWRVKQTPVFVSSLRETESISQNKDLIINIHFIHFLQHTNKPCGNQHTAHSVSGHYNLRWAYGLVGQQRLKPLSWVHILIHSCHNLYITNTEGALGPSVWELHLQSNFNFN